MKAVVYYSNTGQSRAIAEYFSERLGFPLTDIEKAEESNYSDLVLVFPVYCQNIPDVVKAFLERVSVDRLTPIATYGKMCHGNVLREIGRKYRKTIVAAAYLPTKHTYIENDSIFSDYDKLTPIIEKVKAPSEIKLPVCYKNPFADLLPRLRSVVGVKLVKGDGCDGCGVCSRLCSFGAIDRGLTDSTKCIRCLRCVESCPKRALSAKPTLPLKIYLSKKKSDKTVIYV